jgi:SSS family solute:Na+ symporter
MTSGLHWIDGLILAAYASSMVYLGWWHSRGQKTTDEYFVGNRAMNPILIGISLFATLFSTISYLTSPGEVLRYGPVVPLIGILTIPFYYYLVGHLMAPIYMRHRGTSAYALLETQLGLTARLMGASMFVLLRLIWMSVLIYMACKALLVMLAAVCRVSYRWHRYFLRIARRLAGCRDYRHVPVQPAVWRRLAGDWHGQLGSRWL